MPAEGSATRLLGRELLAGDDLRLARRQLDLALLDLGQTAEPGALLGQARLRPLLERAEVGLALLERGDPLEARLRAPPRAS